MSATTAVVGAYVGFKALSAISQGMNNYGEAKRAEELYKYNAAQTVEKIKSLNYEKSMNETLTRLNAYSEISAGKNLMAARGNVGSSADAAVINAYKNLAGDLEAMSFNYSNKRSDLIVERNNYLYQSGIAKAQKKSAIMGGILNVGGTVTGGMAKLFGSGLKI